MCDKCICTEEEGKPCEYACCEHGEENFENCEDQK